jgi:spermidine/putrescine-binding protein
MANDFGRLFRTGLGRREFLRVTGVMAGAGVLAACKKAAKPVTVSPGGTVTRPPVGEEPGNLEVFDWTGYGDDVYGDAFLWKQYKDTFPDEDLQYTVFKDDDSSYAKVATGRRFDLAHPCGYRFADWVALQEGGAPVLQPWDTSLIANYPSLNPKLEAAGLIDGKQYFVVADWGFAAPMYNKDKVEPLEDSWSLLWDERYGGKISWWDSLNMLVVAGYYHGVADPWAMTDPELEDMKDFLIEKKSLVRFMWTGAEIDQAFKTGDVYIAYAWPSSWAVGTFYNDLNLEYMQPKEGRTSWYCGFALFSNTPNYYHAHEYVDAWMGAQSAKWLLENYAYGHTNTTVDLSKLDPQLVETFSLDDPTVLDEPRTHVERPIERRDVYNELWEEVKAA